MTTPIALRQEMFDRGNEEKGGGGNYVVAAVLPTGRTTQAGTSRPGPVLAIASQPYPKEVLTSTGYRLTYSHSHSSSKLGNRNAERLGGVE